MTAKRASKLPPLITIVITLLIMFLGSLMMYSRGYKAHTVELASGSTSTLEHLFNRDTRDEPENRDHIVTLRVYGEHPERLMLEYHEAGEKWYEKEMVRAEGTDLYCASLEGKPKLGRWFYRFHAYYGDEDAVFAQEGDTNFFVTFEGDVPMLLLVSHIALMIATVILFIFVFYYSLEKLVNRRNGKELYLSAFLGTAVFLFAAFVLGPPISGYAFGEPFGAWPFGTDITDTKSFWLIVLWLIPLFLRAGQLTGNEKHNRISARAFAWFCLLALVFSLIVFMIPHSLFIHPESP
ncbi:MAG: hypothetical protein U5N86_01245 [Planctomycetota bacterium]|nr:hypothetical protein [Planctomycetota bacterium]